MNNGVWLSLVEYLNGVQVAAGSNPVTPTTLLKPSVKRRFFDWLTRFLHDFLINLILSLLISHPPQHCDVS